MLTDYHKRLLRTALEGRTSDPMIALEGRLAIRTICVERMPITEPELFVRAFVDALVEAADAEAIPYGQARDALLSQAVSIFVEELRATCDEEVALELGMRRSSPRSVREAIVPPFTP